MTFFKKYKHLSILHNELNKSFLNFRVLKFKRSKWNSLKLKLIKALKLFRYKKIRKITKVRNCIYKINKIKVYIRNNKKFFIHKHKDVYLIKNKKIFFWKKKKLRARRNLVDHLVLSSKTCWWKRLQKSYKTGLFINNSFKSRFGKSFCLKDFKKELGFKKEILYRFLAKPLFKLDILLWKLNFFPSVRAAHQFIKSKNVSLNGLSIERPVFLKKGDIIKLKDFQKINSVFNFKSKSFFMYKKNVLSLKKKTLLEKNRAKLISLKSTLFFNNFLLSFCEVDYYTKTVIIIKDFLVFSRQDFALILRDRINLSDFMYYLIKN